MMTQTQRSTTPGGHAGFEVPSRTGRRSGRADGEGRANGLGWFSLGLGIAELVARGGVARLIGIEKERRSHKTLSAIGLRELASGVGILARPRPAPWVWSRVAGDVIDLALLGRAFTSRKVKRSRLAAATAAVLGITVIDALTVRKLGRAGEIRAFRRGIHVTKSITINRPPEEVYRFWRDLENLPRFMDHLESVRVEDGRSHWRAKGPVGSVIEWEAVIVEDQPNRFLAWRSIEGADVANAGSVLFAPAPGGRGTEVRVELDYAPPAGRLGASVAKLFGEEPSRQIDGDLRRLKQVIETGEVLHSDASIHRGPHAAMPPESVREEVAR